jgi:hypothetical protein
MECVDCGSVATSDHGKDSFLCRARHKMESLPWSVFATGLRADAGQAR